MTLAFAIPPCPDSPLRRLDPRWKLAALALAVILVACLHELLPACVALAGALLLAWLGRLPRRWFLSRLALVLLFVAPFALTLPFFFPGESWWPGVRLGLLLALKAMT